MLDMDSFTKFIARIPSNRRCNIYDDTKHFSWDDLWTTDTAFNESFCQWRRLGHYQQWATVMWQEHMFCTDCARMFFRHQAEPDQTSLLIRNCLSPEANCNKWGCFSNNTVLSCKCSTETIDAILSSNDNKHHNESFSQWRILGHYQQRATVVWQAVMFCTECSRMSSTHQVKPDQMSLLIRDCLYTRT
jgi:hypothetical protein